MSNQHSTSYDPQSSPELVADEFIGSDDYALSRVPESERYSWFTVAMQRFGQLSALGQFMLAAFIGFSLDFWHAMLAITIGCVLLEAVTIFVGIAGQREGMSTSVLARWAGFGRYGGALVGIVIALSLTGWFGIQNQVFATGLNSIWPSVPLWLWCIVGGIAVTLIVVYGFLSMSWVAWITVPAFLILVTFSLAKVLNEMSLSELMALEPQAPGMTMAQAITLVAAGFIVGAVMTPDMSRFNRTPMDVVKQTLVGVTLGEYFVGAIGVLLAHTIEKAMVMENMGNAAGLVVGIIQGSTGVLGVLILTASILKINDWNLYPSSLGITNAAHTLFGVRVNRQLVTIVLGVLGSLLSAAGIAGKFQPFLEQLGIIIPPIAAIMIAEYFVVKAWRAELDESRARGALPSESPGFVIAGLVAWVVGWATAFYLGKHPDMISIVNVPALVSLVVAFVVYVVLGKAGLARGVLIEKTR